MKKLRKFLTVGVMVLSIIAMSGLTVNTAKASAQAGDLIKMDGLSSIYYLGNDGKRYVFPSESVYFSWYNDFSGVVTISASELQSYPLGSNITMRPGTKLVKITTDPSVYAVTGTGVLRKIQSESDAITLYGTNWAKKVVDVADAFFTNYTIGTPLTSGTYPAGTLLKNANNASVYYYDGTNYRLIASEAAFNANRFSFNNVVTTSLSLTASGSSITSAEDLAKPSGTTIGVQPGQGTGLTVALSSDTPAAQNIPTGVAVTMMKLNITASSDGDITVNGLRLTAGGLGAATDIKAVSVYNNGVKLNNTAKNVSSSDKYAEINFTNPLTIAKGTTATLEVRAKLNGTDNYNLSIAKAGDVMTTASVAGSFPVKGNTMSGTTVSDLGQLEVNQDGGTLPDVKLGETQATVAKFKLEASKEDITFKSISLKRTDPTSGTAISDGDLTNLKLYKDGSVIATANGIVNKYVNFVLDSSIVIKDGTTARFEVKADPIDGAGKKVRLVIDGGNDTTDVMAIGNHYGYPVRITANTVGADVLVNAGAISIVKVNAANDKVKKDTKKVEAGSFKITVNNGKTVELSTFNLTVVTSETASTSELANIENIQLYDRTTGTSYDMDHVSMGSASQTHVYKNDSMGLTMHGGETHELVVRFDTIKDAAEENYTFKIAQASSDLTIKETANDTRIDDITPNSVELKKVSIQAADANITRNALSSTLSATAGSSDVELYSFNIKAGESSDIKVNTLRFKDESGDTVNNNVVSEFKLWKGTTVLATKSSSQLSSEEITFDNVNETIAANQTVAYHVTASLVKRTTIPADQNELKYSISGYDMEDTDKGNAVYVAFDSNTNGVKDGSEVWPVANRTVTIVGTSTLHISIDNTVDATKYDAYTLAGIASGPLASIKMKADDGEALLTKLKLDVEGLGSATPSNVFSELSLWDGSNQVAATTNLNENTIIFDNINLEVPTSEKIYTLKGTLNNIGKNQAGVLGLDSIVFRPNTESEAQDFSSGDDLTGSHLVIATSTPSMKIGAVATKITAISSETTDGQGHTVDSKLTSGSNVVGIIKVTTPSTTNTNSDGTQVKTAISSFKFKTAITGTASTTLDSMTIEKVGGAGESAAATSSTEYFTVNVKTGDVDVTPGTTVYYVVRANVSNVPGGNTASASFQAKFDALNDASTANVTWKDSSMDSTTAYTTLRINGLNNIDFPKLNN